MLPRCPWMLEFLNQLGDKSRAVRIPHAQLESSLAISHYYVSRPDLVRAGRGTQALIQELGGIDTLRFLQQFRTGSGNYAIDHQTLVADEAGTPIGAGDEIALMPPLSGG